MFPIFSINSNLMFCLDFIIFEIDKSRFWIKMLASVTNGHVDTTAMITALGEENDPTSWWRRRAWLTALMWCSMNVEHITILSFRNALLRYKNETQAVEWEKKAELLNASWASSFFFFNLTAVFLECRFMGETLQKTRDTSATPKHVRQT